jgi:hypothetical protein
LIAVLILALGHRRQRRRLQRGEHDLAAAAALPRSAAVSADCGEKPFTSGESSMTYTADATQDFQQQNRSFQSVSGYFAFTPPDNFKLDWEMTGHCLLPASLVAEGFFQTLGVEPTAGAVCSGLTNFVQHAPPVRPC